MAPTEVKGTPSFISSTVIQECSFLACKDLAETVQKKKKKSALEGLFYSHIYPMKWLRSNLNSGLAP